MPLADVLKLGTFLVIAAYLVVADEGYGRQIPFVFLERVADEFESKLGAKARTAAANSLDKQFGYDCFHSSAPRVL